MSFQTYINHSHAMAIYAVFKNHKDYKSTTSK